MQNFLKLVLDKTVIPVIQYIFSKLSSEVRDSAYQLNLHKTLRERAVHDAASYVEQNLEHAMVFLSKPQLWDYTISALEGQSGLHLEFGVYTGGSINYFSKNMPDTQFNGFDSFIGLEEDWKGHHRTKGHFNLDGNLPKVNKNVSLHKGFFSESLPLFLEKHQDDCAFLHIDSDTYEACDYLLNILKPKIKKGTIILFDEYFGYIGWKHGEFKSWQEFTVQNNIQYEYLAFSHDQCVLRVS